MTEDIGAADLERLLARAGLPMGDCLVQESQGRPGGRELLRLSGPEREPLKVRSFATPQDAAAMVQLRGLIGEHPGFSRVLACWGPHVLEEWVPGSCLLSGEVTSAQARACGVLLAELHQIPLSSGSPSGASVRHLAEESHTRLHELARVGALTPAVATHLARELHSLAPRHARQGLIHFDFCGENLVWAERRGIVSIDNERLRIGPFASDIGRTLALWRLPAAAQHAFLTGYSAAGGPAEAGDRAFWTLVALVTSAWFRVSHHPATAERPLKSLRAWGTGSRVAGP